MKVTRKRWAKVEGWDTTLPHYEVYHQSTPNKSGFWPRVDCPPVQKQSAASFISEVAKAFETFAEGIRKAAVEVGKLFGFGIADGIRTPTYREIRRAELGEEGYRAAQKALRADIIRVCAGHRRRQERIGR